MKRLPLSVIGGFLGAGKTTFINRLLTANHGMRLVVLVNDFGAINIDASLLQSKREDTIEMTNGCVCCTMSGDLFFTIGDILDRTERPDHLIIEASGIADPAKIATVALAEQELRYAGILTIVDGLNFPIQISDTAISDQLKSQVKCADFVAVSKTSPDQENVKQALTRLSVSAWTSADDIAILQSLLFANAILKPPKSEHTGSHPEYVHWSYAAPTAMTQSDILQRFEVIPNGILRLKALIPCDANHAWEIHLVGRHKTIEKCTAPHKFGIVVLGHNASISEIEIKNWWLHS
ncbi:CobW family GTP-binding protein [Pseudopelagicola sp. nBUS_20]|uniref:CobW family GTP-binding protein n=1 Tax=Pseudopelagicola sp. nBUS_20 TaxID=3395317 RepID=UPI003EBA6DF6